MRTPYPRLMCVAVAILILASAARAGDWPQILGPHRNGAAPDEALPDRLPAGGPKTVWTHRLGAGYAGPAVSGEVLVIFHRVGDVERVEALDAATGKARWKADFEASYRGGINPDLGPRAVPVVHQDRVIVYGAAGDLHCLDLTTGRKLWSRAAAADYGAQEGYFGFGSTPIVVDDKVLVNVGGGRQEAGIVAFALDTGKTVWKTLADDASYSSPTTAMIDGQKHVIFVTRLNCVSVDPATGQVRFQFPFGQRGPTVNAAMPLVFEGNRLFVSAAYGVGAVLAEITPRGAERVWANDASMSSQYNTCVYRQGHLYGVDGREDYNNGKLRCVHAETGKVIWSADDFGVAHVILAGDRLLALKVTGEVVIVPATPAGFRPLATAQLATDAVTRALPALSNGRLYFRTNTNNAGVLKCIALREGE